VSAAGPGLSVIIAARDAAATLGACLDGVFAQAGPDVEVIVVDDASRDATAGVAARYPVSLVRCERWGGVASARNRGAAAAAAPLLLFLDADVVPGPGLLARARRAFDDPATDAVFGSYDDEPAVRSTVSRFKNLAHHHVHQHARRRATTFFAGCGAIRRARFVAAGGFDEARYRRPSIEDVELGGRLAAQGARIIAAPGLQVKHLKRWTLGSLLVTDLVRRAIPWTQLILERRSWPGDLNLAPRQLAAAGIALLLIALLPFLAHPVAAAAWPALLAGAVIANHGLYTLFWRKGGARLAVAGFVLQQLYYLYAAVGFAVGVGLFPWRVRDRSAAVPRPEMRPAPSPERTP
jgi:GT2 family glycosyltransferase